MHMERGNPPDGKGTHGTPREEGGSRRQKEEEPQSVSRRVAGNLSSTRAELAAIAQAVNVPALLLSHDLSASCSRMQAFTEKFHSREGAGWKEPGETIQRCGDWTVTGWIRPATALLPSGKDVQEVEDENGR
jgi:hypothetical protein